MHTIVGIDPGTTAGIAVLNFKGELVDLFSSKDMGIDEVLKHIIEFGIASVIASDVNPSPQFVNKISARTGAVVFKPDKTLPVKEKTELTKNFTIEDAHQRDSLAAAINAFNKFKNKFAKIDATDFNEFLSEEQKDEIKHLVVHGHSIDSAIKDLIDEGKGEEEKKEEKRKEEIEPELSAEIQKIKDLENQNKVLREEIKIKEREISELEDKIFEVKGKYKLELHRDKKIKEDGQIIKSFEYGMKDLQERLNEKIAGIDNLVELWNTLAKGDIIPVGIFPEKFGGISWLRRKFKKKDYKNLQRIKILFAPNPQEHKDLLEKRILVCDEKYIKEFSGCAYVTYDDLETAKKEAEEMKYKMTKVDERKLTDIIQSYRSERN